MTPIASLKTIYEECWITKALYCAGTGFTEIGTISRSIALMRNQ